MEDEKIIELFWNRNETAISETASKYGKLLFGIANSILVSREDCEECVNDTYAALWNAIPDKRPSRFSAFAGKITRNLALKKFEHLSAGKRKPETVYSLEELEECVSGREYVENEAENRRVEQMIDTFMWNLDEEKRTVFIRRYWYFDTVDELCRQTGYTRSKIKSMLLRTRRKLREYLESEGVDV